jgi:hypothetical protein
MLFNEIETSPASDEMQARATSIVPGRWLAYYGGKLVGTDGDVLFNVVRKGKTDPRYQILTSQLHIAKGPGGRIELVTIPED